MSCTRTFAPRLAPLAVFVTALAVTAPAAAGATRIAIAATRRS